MSRSFGIVEEKLREADFFLEAMCASDPISYAARFYFSAFISAGRSVTFAMQASLSDVPAFQEWYKTAQQELKTDQFAPLFVELRNEVVHVGSNRLNQVTVEHLRQSLTQQMFQARPSHFLIIPNPAKVGTTELVDAVEISTTYLVSLVRVVFNCYSRFKTVVDPEWYFTSDHFKEMGKTFTDALVELGMPATWADNVDLGPDPFRLLRRQQPPCQVNDLFQKHLGQEIAGPDSA